MAMASLRAPYNYGRRWLCRATKHACSTSKRFAPNSGPSKQFISFHVASWERADYRRLRHMEWECRPWLFTPSCGWGRFELALHRSTRSTTMFRGIAIALFGLTILSQLDQALFYGRNTDAAFRLVREISRAFGV